MVIGTFHLFDETRSSLLSSSVVKVHHSFGRAHENGRACAGTRGSAERSSRWPSDRGDPVPGLPMVRRPRPSRKDAGGGQMTPGGRTPTTRAVEPRRLEL